MSLKTDYKDYIPATTLRKYQQVDNGDGTVSFQDVTDYTQVGDKFGANEANGIGTEVNAIADSAVQSATLGGTAVPKNGTTLQLPAYPTSLPANGGNANYANSAGSAPANGGDAATLNGHGTDNGSNSVLLSGRLAGSTIGDKSTAEGCETTANGYASHAEGYNTIAFVYGSHAEGQYNKLLTGNSAYYMSTAGAFVIGNGTTSSDKSNAFKVTFDGRTYGLSAFNSTGADYSEYFEWLDGNPNAEDRAGKFVTLDGEKIKFANDGDFIAGIVSATPAIIGDSASESWNGRYLTDIFGRIQYHDVEIPEEIQTITHEDGTTESIIIREAHTELHPIYNPDYDPTLENEYQNRESRKEWATVGMFGKLICIDDGTCEVNGYCKPLNGIATTADAGYRVMARIDSTHIRVLIK